MNRAWELVVDAAAAYRLTRLATADSLLHGPRDAIIAAAYEREERGDEVAADAPPGTWLSHVSNDDDPPKLAELVSCPWCTGVYVGLAVVVARKVAPRQWDALATGLALAAAAALARGLERS